MLIVSAGMESVELSIVTYTQPFIWGCPRSCLLVWCSPSPLLEDVAGPTNLLDGPWKGTSTWGHACSHNWQLWQGQGHFAKVSISAHPKETHLWADQEFIDCSITILFFWGFDMPPWWCPNCEPLTFELVSKTKDHQWLWQDAWSTGMEFFSIWGMRGWLLERAGHWKLFPDWSKKLNLEIMALYQDGNISNHLQSTG